LELKRATSSRRAGCGPVSEGSDLESSVRFVSKAPESPSKGLRGVSGTSGVPEDGFGALESFLDARSPVGLRAHQRCPSSRRDVSDTMPGGKLGNTTLLRRGASWRRAGDLWTFSPLRGGCGMPPARSEGLWTPPSSRTTSCPLSSSRGSPTSLRTSSGGWSRSSATRRSPSRSWTGTGRPSGSMCLRRPAG